MVEGLPSGTAFILAEQAGRFSLNFNELAEDFRYLRVCGNSNSEDEAVTDLIFYHTSHIETNFISLANELNFNYVLFVDKKIEPYSEQKIIFEREKREKDILSSKALILKNYLKSGKPLEEFEERFNLAISEQIYFDADYQIRVICLFTEVSEILLMKFRFPEINTFEYKAPIDQ